MLAPTTEFNDSQQNSPIVPNSQGSSADCNHSSGRQSTGVSSLLATIFGKIPDAAKIPPLADGTPGKESIGGVPEALVEHSLLGVKCQRAIAAGDKLEAIRLTSELVVSTESLGDGVPQTEIALAELRGLRSLLEQTPAWMLWLFSRWIARRLRRATKRFGQEAIIVAANL